MHQQGCASEDHNEAQTDPLHAIDGQASEFEKSNEGHRQNDGHTSRPIEVYGLVDHKKRQDWKPVSQ